MTPEELARWFKPTTTNEQILHSAIVSLVEERALTKAIIWQVVDDLNELC